MRKFIQLLIVSLFSFPLLGSSNADINGILLNQYPKQSILYNSLEPLAADDTGELFILPEGDFDQQEAARIINRIALLPDSMLEKTAEHNIKIKLFEGNLTDNPSVRHLKGVIPRGYESGKTWDDVPGIGGSKLVLVKIGSSQRGHGHGSVNLELHELAHSLDRYVYGGIREDERFEQIWRKESSLLFPGQSYFLDYPEEYFAEAFAMFYIGGIPARLLKQKAPRTFEYIDSLE